MELCGAIVCGTSYWSNVYGDGVGGFIKTKHILVILIRKVHGKLRLKNTGYANGSVLFVPVCSNFFQSAQFINFTIFIDSGNIVITGHLMDSAACTFSLCYYSSPTCSKIILLYVMALFAHLT